MLDRVRDPVLEGEERLLAFLGGFLVLGAFAGASVTALTLLPARGLAALPELLGAGLLALAGATGGIASTGLAYLLVACHHRRLDHRVAMACAAAVGLIALTRPPTAPHGGRGTPAEHASDAHFTDSSACRASAR